MPRPSGLVARAGVGVRARGARRGYRRTSLAGVGERALAHARAVEALAPETRRGGGEGWSREDARGVGGAFASALFHLSRCVSTWLSLRRREEIVASSRGGRGGICGRPGVDGVEDARERGVDVVLRRRRAGEVPEDDLEDVVLRVRVGRGGREVGRQGAVGASPPASGGKKKRRGDFRSVGRAGRGEGRRGERQRTGNAETSISPPARRQALRVLPTGSGSASRVARFPSLGAADASIPLAAQCTRRPPPRRASVDDLISERRVVPASLSARVAVRTPRARERDRSLAPLHPEPEPAPAPALPATPRVGMRTAARRHPKRGRRKKDRDATSEERLSSLAGRIEGLRTLETGSTARYQRINKYLPESPTERRAAKVKFVTPGTQLSSRVFESPACLHPSREPAGRRRGDARARARRTRPRSRPSSTYGHARRLGDDAVHGG